MHKTIIHGLLALLVLFPVAAFAAEAKRSVWLQILISWVPFIALIVIWLFYMRGSGIRKNSKYIDRSLEHMDRVEKLLEKIVEQNKRDK